MLVALVSALAAARLALERLLTSPILRATAATALVAVAVEAREPHQADTKPCPLSRPCEISMSLAELWGWTSLHLWVMSCSACCTGQSDGSVALLARLVEVDDSSA